jgi:hypothetical protein
MMKCKQDDSSIQFLKHIIRMLVCLPILIFLQNGYVGLRVTGIRHIYKPGTYRMQVMIGDVSNTIEIAEHMVRKELEQPEQQTPKALPTLTKHHVPHTFEGKAFPEPKPPSLWSKLTPWKEEAGETFGSEVAERWRSATPWQEEAGETFGEEVSERWQIATPWQEQEGETFGSEVAERAKAVGGFFSKLNPFRSKGEESKDNGQSTNR